MGTGSRLSFGISMARMRSRALGIAGVVLACGLLAAGCENLDGAQVLRSTFEGMVRGACRSASNCSNTCPDGGEARAPLYRCPSADKVRHP